MPLDALDQIERDAWASLKPPAKLRLSEWTEQNVYLPASLAAAPGLMRLFPYQREMADAMSDPEVERVTACKGARVGWTQLTVAALAHFVANDPSSVLAVLPTESDSRHMMTGIIEPTFRASPALSDALTADSAGRDTMLTRHFPGGNLTLVSASSPRNLRARSAAVLIADEVDSWETDARGEGEPLSLAEKRTLTFDRRKLIVGSTPLDEETSRVLALYNRSDRRVWECPCQHCGDYHEIVWADIRWEPDCPETAAWTCPSCGAITEDHEKAPMLLAGRWRATRPEVKGHAGFRINALSSLLANAAWPKLAAEFLEAKKSPVTLKAFVTTILGQPWRAEGDDLDPDRLTALQRPHSLDTIPEDVLFLTAGADIQGDRIELTTAGWTAAGDCRVMAHEIVWGEPLEDATWRELDDLLTRQWVHPGGGILKLDAAVIDSGNWSDAVYAFTRPRTSRRVIAGKGVPGFNRPYLAWGNSRKTRLALIAVDAIKLHMHQRLQAGETITFSEHLGQDYLDQIASERLVTKYTRGYAVRRFEKTAGRRNEALDTLAYLTAAKNLIAVPVETRERQLCDSRSATPLKAVVKSNWLSG
ncbi:MAG: phage terminase large subunit family protein [Marinibacterium sp.]